MDPEDNRQLVLLRLVAQPQALTARSHRVLHSELGSNQLRRHSKTDTCICKSYGCILDSSL